MARERLVFRLGRGASAVVHLERVADGVFEFEVSTSAPGWGGLHGRRPPSDVRFANEYNATLAALHAARRYWLEKQCHRLVAALDEALDNDWFDFCPQELVR